jgi:Golgi-body localisation protein domain/RNA pol II promoter Fmp27 protein domain/Mitochondrial protein from FMP27/Domain of unknown function (DUF2405)
VPYDDIIESRIRYRRLRGEHHGFKTPKSRSSVSFTDMMEELDDPGSRDKEIVQTVSDSREFVSSLLRGVQEIQIAISFIGLSKTLDMIRPSGKPMYLHFAMNEFGIDLFRLDSRSPAHRMYFSRHDIAHQALLAAISISVSIDDGSAKPERLVYLPMATTTVKTTLPSKTVAGRTAGNVDERNTNILFANFVMTSPSVDVNLKHMPIVLALLRSNTRNQDVRRSSSTSNQRARLMSRLLPKASIKLSIQEPVARVVLPPPKPYEADDFDLLISTASSISLDIESSHSSAKDVQYAFISNFRLASQQLYYQSGSGERHNLLENDALEIRMQVSATPEISMIVSGNLETFFIHMIRPEISKGVRQITKQLKQHARTRAYAKGPASGVSFLRHLPTWLVFSQFRGTNFGVEVAGVDPGVSPDLRGIALQLESWTLDYKVQRGAGLPKYKNLHRALSKSMSSEDALAQTFRTRQSKRPESDSTDGRRLNIQVQNLQSFVVEGAGKWESTPIASLPKLDLAASTLSDQYGSVTNVSLQISALMLQYSLYRYYAAGIANGVLRRAFAMERPASPSPDDDDKVNVKQSSKDRPAEVLHVETKLGYGQIKAHLPAGPPLLLQLYGVEAGRQRWSTPQMRAKVLRLCTETPGIKSAWSRLVGVRHLRVDFRTSRRKVGKEFVDGSLIDISSELSRLAIPHQVVLHHILDSMVNAFKASLQLQHRFETGTDDYVLKKGPQEPKKVPKISFRSRNLMFELEDSAFEWRLGLIYRVGLNEQKRRLAREEAYRIKVKQLEEPTKAHESSRTRTKHRHWLRRSRSQPSHDPESAEGRAHHAKASFWRRTSHSESRGRQMRYNADTVEGFSSTAKISIDQAWTKLQEHNAASWRTRITEAMKRHADATHDIRSLFLGEDETPHYEEDTETMVAMPARPGLMTAIISDIHILVDKPSFPMSHLPQYLYSVGKGLPLDTRFSLLVPVSLQVNMGEARVSLRNYPIPILHIPALKAGQSSRLPSWSLKTDFVVAEEFREGEESMRHAKVEIVPASKFVHTQEHKGGFFVDVRRTVSQVKTYSDVDVSINTNDATSIAWGTSYQPAIQDMMQVIESFTKPPPDPSERMGFWDKIRLIFHSRIRVNWRGDGDVHLRLKGSRDPYLVTGHGSGFVMCFRQNVRWDIHQDNDPKKFMTVSCGEYVLAIPDYSTQARQLTRDGSSGDADKASSTRSRSQNALFQKVIMKLSGDVRWLVGFVFERESDDGTRSFDFRPHYNVTLKSAQYAKDSEGKVYDAFRGFRSNHIHLSVAVIAPVDRDWSVTNITASNSYNSIHLSPRFFTHFFDWWSLFSGVMSLPIRQGKLFPGREKTSKKFGRHIATIKYNLLLSPFFIAHIYKHKDIEDYAEDAVGATGLKLRIDSFMLDLHQRREKFTHSGHGNYRTMRTSAMKINKVQLDFMAVDLRAVSASIAGTSLEELKNATDTDIAILQDRVPSTPDLSRFEIPDNDFLWIDMDDFVELDWILPAETHPETRIMPLAFAPHFTYFRQTDQNGVISGDTGRSSRFGDEPTHFCIMGQDNDPLRVQCDLVRERIRILESQLETHRQMLSDAEAHQSQDSKDSKEHSILEEEITSLEQQVKACEDRGKSMQAMLNDLLSELRKSSGEFAGSIRRPSTVSTDSEDMEFTDAPSQPLKLNSDFNNRFIVHNVQLKWNNSLRNIILRYVHQVSQRRGFVYYMSRRAVKFILDIVDEQKKSRSGQAASTEGTPATEKSSGPSLSDMNDSNFNLQERIQDLLNDARTFVDANDPNQARPSTKHKSDDLRDDVAEAFVAQNSYHVRLIAPQIQLQSEKNPKSILLVTGKGMEMKVIQIMDKSRLADDVSGLVQRRFSLDMDAVQFFVTSQTTLKKFVHLYSGNRYGAPKGSIWPPWIPLEVNFDFDANPFGWYRVVQRTSASLRYDKYNTLRLKYNDEVSKGDEQTSAAEEAESRLDHLWVEFLQIRAICDSTQYYTLYVIVLDLLLYNEPLEKSRSERLEKIMLAADFSDLTGAPEMVTRLQERIRQLEEIKLHFKVHAKYLDRQGWEDRLNIESDLAGCEDELFFIMKAITTSQRKYDDRSQKQMNSLLRWNLSANEIVWHLMREENKPLVEIQLNKATYERTDNSDGSNYNAMEIERIHGLNLLPNAIYPEMIGPYFDRTSVADGDAEHIKMFKVQWYMLEAIAGIPVLDQFEVNLFPLKIQLEREVGQRLFEYIFPTNAGRDTASPFIVNQMGIVENDDNDSDDMMSATLVPEVVTSSYEDSQPSTRTGSIDLRLRPTLNLEPPSPSRPGSSHRQKSSLSPNPGIIAKRSPAHLGQKSPAMSQSSFMTASRASSQRPRESAPSLRHASENNDSTPSVPTLTGVTAPDRKGGRFNLARSSNKNDTDENKPSDDLTEMMSRASNYMTLAYVKIPSVVLCLSYKGRGERNIEDVHNFVFRMPSLEYRNKTWSNLDLALRLKKDVIKALISHTGAIIGNKFSHHRPSKVQQSRLRELASSSSLLPNTNLSNTLARTATTIRSSLSSPPHNNSDTGLSSLTPGRLSVNTGTTRLHRRSDGHLRSDHQSEDRVSSSAGDRSPASTISSDAPQFAASPPRMSQEANISSDNVSGMAASSDGQGRDEEEDQGHENGVRDLHE